MTHETFQPQFNLPPKIVLTSVRLEDYLVYTAATPTVTPNTGRTPGVRWGFLTCTEGFKKLLAKVSWLMGGVLKAFLQYNFNNAGATHSHSHTLSPPLFAAANFSAASFALCLHLPLSLHVLESIFLLFFAHKTNYRQWLSCVNNWYENTDLVLHSQGRACVRARSDTWSTSVVRSLLYDQLILNLTYYYARVCVCAQALARSAWGLCSVLVQ